MDKGYIVVENGPCFPGLFRAGENQAGELVFNTSHFGYEEIATDPSYFNQIMIMTSPMMGNYGVDDEVWESNKYYINGFACLEIQSTEREQTWLGRLNEFSIPVLTDFDTRKLVTYLRDQGTTWGAIVKANSESEAKEVAKELIAIRKDVPSDWPHIVSREKPEGFKGSVSSGPRVAVMDFGCKQNIIRELQKRCSAVKVFNSRSSENDIMAFKPDGLLLSNGPGDPDSVEVSSETVASMIGKLPIFGICMGHQILGRALGAKTYRLTFGHRGSNHPIKDLRTNDIFMTSQNHGYAIDEKTLPKEVKVSHMNLNDQTVSGIDYKAKKAFSVQFHPESHPGPRDAETIFDEFIDECKN